MESKNAYILAENVWFHFQGDTFVPALKPNVQPLVAASYYVLLATPSKALLLLH